MASSAEGNISKALFSEGARYDGGLTPDDAERFAAAFKPSWEVEDAPYAAPAGEPRELEMVGMPPSARAAAAFENGHAHAVSAHAPAGRIATHEPDASVIIDASPPPRSVPAPAPSGSAPPAASFGPGAASFHPPPPAPAPQFPSHAIAHGGPAQQPGFNGAHGGLNVPRTASHAPAASTLTKTAPPARYTAADSAEFPVKKSSKPLFIGIGIAVALAALVLGVRAATSDSDGASATPAVTATPAQDEPSIPPPEDTPAARSVPVVSPSSLPRATSSPQGTRPAVLAPPSQPAPAHAAVVAPPAAAPHAAAPPPAPRVVAAPPQPARRPSPAPAPKSPPKPASGGIVRDVPF